MAEVKKRDFGSLLVDVVKTDLCTACGGCVASCTVRALAMKGESPALVGPCAVCEVCYYSCPQTTVPYAEIEKALFSREGGAENSIGIYREVYSAKTKLEDVGKVAQDGGAVTTMLIYALKEGMVDSAIVAGFKDKPWEAWPMVALNVEDLIKAAGTKYTPSPGLIGLNDAVLNYGRSRVAFVGTPCQIRAVRQMQFNRKGCLKLGERVAVAIGLFCMESFSYDRLMEEFLKAKGCELKEVSKFAIKRGKFIVYVRGREVINVPLSEVKSFVRGSCHKCRDFSAELSDISVGSVGSPDGWSTVVIRSGVGEDLFKRTVNAGLLEVKPISEVKPGLSSIIKLSIKKREGAG